MKANFVMVCVGIWLLGSSACKKKELKYEQDIRRTGSNKLNMNMSGSSTLRDAAAQPSAELQFDDAQYKLYRYNLLDKIEKVEHIIQLMENGDVTYAQFIEFETLSNGMPTLIEECYNYAEEHGIFRDKYIKETDNSGKRGAELKTNAKKAPEDVYIKELTPSGEPIRERDERGKHVVNRFRGDLRALVSRFNATQERYAYLLKKGLIPSARSGKRTGKKVTFDSVVKVKEIPLELKERKSPARWE